MVKGVEQPCCLNCIHLQREDPIVSGQMALYRCSSQKSYRNRVVGWVQKDKPELGLKVMGGSCCNKLYPGDVISMKGYFSEKSEEFLYCGKLRGRRLVVSLSDHVPHVVENSWLRGQTGVLRKINFRIVMQSEKQREYNRKIAKEFLKEYKHE